MPSLRPIKILIVSMVTVIGLQAGAQAGKATSSSESKTTKVLGSQLNTILEFGLAGGVLGLSTLSFYGRPQDKLAHVPVGMALGIIIGAVYSTTQVVTDPSQIVTQTESTPVLLNWTVDF